MTPEERLVVLENLLAKVRRAATERGLGLPQDLPAGAFKASRTGDAPIALTAFDEAATGTHRPLALVDAPLPLVDQPMARQEPAERDEPIPSGPLIEFQNAFDDEITSDGNPEEIEALVLAKLEAEEEALANGASARRSSTAPEPEHDASPEPAPEHEPESERHPEPEPEVHDASPAPPRVSAAPAPPSAPSSAAAPVSGSPQSHPTRPDQPAISRLAALAPGPGSPLPAQSPLSARPPLTIHTPSSPPPRAERVSSLPARASAPPSVPLELDDLDGLEFAPPPLIVPRLAPLRAPIPPTPHESSVPPPTELRAAPEPERAPSIPPVEAGPAEAIPLPAEPGRVASITPPPPERERAPSAPPPPPPSLPPEPERVASITPPPLLAEHVASAPPPPLEPARPPSMPPSPLQRLSSLPPPPERVPLSMRAPPLGDEEVFLAEEDVVSTSVPPPPLDAAEQGEPLGEMPFSDRSPPEKPAMVVTPPPVHETDASELQSVPESQRQMRVEERPVDDALEGISEPPPESGEVESQRYAANAPSRPDIERQAAAFDDSPTPQPSYDVTAEVRAFGSVDVVERPPPARVEVASFQGRAARPRVSFGELLDDALDVGRDP